MSVLITAILHGDTQAIRSLSLIQPGLLSAPSFDALLPLELAHRKGRVNSVVALLRAGAPGQLPITAVELLIDYMREVSSDYACAVWLNDIEYTLWHLLQTGHSGGDDLFQLAADSEVLNDLRYLAEQCQGWVRYQVTGPEYISLPEWTRYYDNWKLTHA